MTAHHASKAIANGLTERGEQEAAAHIRKLDTEVFRLRQAIGVYLYGRMERHELREISKTWNAQSGDFREETK